MRPSRKRCSASLNKRAATSGPETIREIDMRRMSKLPNTETDIFEWSSHAWSWRVFGRSGMVIFIEEQVMLAATCQWKRWSGVCLGGRVWWFFLLITCLGFLQRSTLYVWTYSTHAHTNAWPDCTRHSRVFTS